MQIILLNGKAGSGKDETAKKIKLCMEYAGFKTAISQVANRMKYVMEISNQYSGNDNEKPRSEMQEYATDLREMYGPTVFAQDGLETVKYAEVANIDCLIFSDIRTVAEIEYFKENCPNVTVIRVLGKENIRDMSVEEKQHYTEVDLDNREDLFDYVINNSLREDLTNEDKVAYQNLESEIMWALIQTNLVGSKKVKV